MANTLSKYGFVLHRAMDGASVPLETVYTTSNLTFKVGDPVRLSTTGLAVKPTAVSTKAGYIYGFAAEPVTAKAATIYPMRIVPARPDVLFRACSGSTLNVTKGYIGRTAGIWASGLVAFAGNPGAPTLSQLQIVGIVGGGGPLGAGGATGGSAFSTYAELLYIVKHSQWVGQIT